MSADPAQTPCDKRHTGDILTATPSPCFDGGMTTTPTPANARLVGDGPSYTLGVEDMPWQGENGPTTTVHGWSFSTCSPIWDPATNQVTPGVKVSSFDSSTGTHPSEWARHPELDGRVFATTDEARQLAYELGVLRYFFYRSGR